jgi:PmbA protein
VIFDRDVAMEVLDPMLGAIYGPSLARGQSFLKDKLGERIFPKAFEIVDEPFTVRGFGSSETDGEGLPMRRRAIIDDGVLTTWILDFPSARRLGLDRTAHAGDLSNLAVTPGPLDREGLMRRAGQGLLVTDVFGPSLNPNNGDWSAGVAGFWFENGAIAYPVSEITVAGCLPDVYATLTAGSDLEIRSARSSPSLLAPEMTIGGK